MKYSIVIPTFNRCFITLAVVSNLYHLLKKSKINYEFVVVDDGSTDLTEKIFIDFSRYIENLVLVKTDKVLGSYRNPGFARNAGAKNATGDILCFCDGDIIHLINPIQEMQKYLDCKDINNFYFTGLHYRLFSNGNLEGPRGLNSDMPHGSWLAISRKNFLDIGGYDERFKIYGNEDQDIVQRLRRKGLKHIVLNQNLAIHPLFEGDRDIALESETLKKIQLEYQRESNIERNKNINWGKGGVVSQSSSEVNTYICQEKNNSTVDANDIFLKIDSINMAINSLVEGQVLEKKIFNMVNNINQNTVSSINNIFNPKPVDNNLQKSVFNFVDLNVSKIFSDFNGFEGNIKKLDQLVDIVILSQLHRQRNVGFYLDKAYENLKFNGQLVILCPFYSNSVGSGNTNSLWNAGYLIYSLILAGFDCKQAKLSTFKNEIQIYLKKNNREVPKTISLDSLVDYFPFDVYQHFNGNIKEVNWK